MTKFTPSTLALGTIRKFLPCQLLATSALTAAGLLALSAPAMAQDDWSDHVAEDGNISINLDQGNRTTNITQHTHTVKVKGDGDIKANWTVDIKQNNSSSKYVLYDTEGDATHIMGNLKANGQVYIFDKNGVIFGDNSQVDVGTLVTGTGVADYMNVVRGKFDIQDIEGDIDISKGASITIADNGVAAFVGRNVTNAGHIKANMGKVVLAGQESAVNSGKIDAAQSKVDLIAGAETVTIDLHGDGLFEITLNEKLENALVENSGDIIAEGGQVLLTAAAAKDSINNMVNMNGVIDVSSATVQGGKIILGAGKTGTIKTSGTMKASGKSGGQIKVTSKTITMEETSIVVASANETTNEANRGDGGRIEIIAEEKLHVAGELKSVGRTDENGEKTGFVETSAPTVTFSEMTDIGAGHFLLDPTNIIVDSVLKGILEGQLVTGGVEIETPAGGADAGFIRFDKQIIWNTANSFKATAHDDIIFTAGSGLLSNGGGYIELNSGNNVRMEAGNFAIRTTGGNVAINTPNEFTLEGGFINAGGGDITINNGAGFSALADTVQTEGTGTITLNQNADILGIVGMPTASIQNSINAIRNTGTGTNIINVGAGTFTENVVVNEDNTQLRGNNFQNFATGPRNAETTIDADGGIGFLVTADNVLVDGFSVENSTIGAKVDGASNSRIANLIVTSPVTSGIQFLNTQDVNQAYGNFVSGSSWNGIEILSADGTTKIFGNTVDGSAGSGIFSNTSDNVEIGVDGGNTVQGNIRSIYLRNTKNAQVDNNFMQDTRDGILIRGSGNLSADNNTIIARDNGIEFGPTDSNKDVSGVDIDLTNNTITADSDAIRFEGQINEGADVDIDGNTLNTTEIGVNFKGLITGSETTVDVTSNTINADIAGVAVDGGSSDGAQVTIGGEDKIEDGNTINGADIGVRIQNGQGVDVLKNTLNDQILAGVQILDSAETNVEANMINHAGRHGVEVQRVTGETTIDGNMITDSGWNGVFINRSTDGTVHADNNIIDGAVTGVRVDRSENVIVGDIDGNNNSGNTITNTVRGAMFRLSGNSRFEDNSVTESRDGALFQNNFGIMTVKDNTLNVTDNGIELGSFNSEVNNAVVYDIINNTITALTDGVQVFDVVRGGADINMYDNTIWAMDDGIDFQKLVSEASSIDIARNVIQNGDNGIVFATGATEGTTIIIGGVDEDDGNTITGIEGKGNNGILLLDVHSSDILNNNIYNQRVDGIHNFWFNSANIQGNLVDTTGDDGIESVMGHQVTIKGNTVYNAGLLDTGDSETDNGDYYGEKYAALQTWEQAEYDYDYKEPVYRNDVYEDAAYDKNGYDIGFGADAIHVREVYNPEDINAYDGQNNNVAIGEVSVDTDNVVIQGNIIGQADIELPLDDSLTDEPTEITSITSVTSEGYIAGAADDGIQVLWSGNTKIGGSEEGEGNEIANVGYGSAIDDEPVKYDEDKQDRWGADGIHVLNGFLPDSDGYDVKKGGDKGQDIYDQYDDVYISDGYDKGYETYQMPYFLQTSANVVGNTIVNSQDEGIEVEGATDQNVSFNTVDGSGDNGIKTIGYAGFFETETFGEDDNTEFETTPFNEGEILSIALIEVTDEYSPYYITAPAPEFVLTEEGNTVTNSGLEATFGLDGGNGSESNNFDLATREGNTISESLNRGMLQSGPFNGVTEMFDNTLTNNDIQIEFQSGLADLTGTPGNRMVGGRVGLRFNPHDFDNYEEFMATCSISLPYGFEPQGPEAQFADLTLVDTDGAGSTSFPDTPTNFAGTIGSQIFDGQSESFVELNGDFYQGPFWLNGLNSTYNIPGTGFVTPVSTGGNVPQDQLDFLESRFVHFPDDSNVGIFFFGEDLVEIDQEDVFIDIIPQQFADSGLDVTVTGPVSIPGDTAAQFASISPFAGGEGEEQASQEVTPESLNAIATAAGESGEASTCWTDTFEGAQGGQVTRLTHTSDFASRVDEAVDCNAGPDSN